MYAIAFQTIIKDGVIKIPEHYLSKLNGNVKVIVLTDEQITNPDIIDKLMDSPLQIAQLKPLSRDDIYDSRK